MFVEADLPDLIIRAALLPAIGLLWVVLLIRVNGLRSLSKMTNFDFVMTVALGSLLAGFSQATEWPDAAQAAIAMAGLFAVQWASARVRRASDAAESVLSNQPVLLMRDGRILDDALDRTRVSRADLFSKLREANVLHMSEVRAVVLEETGDVSVLHGEALEETLLSGVDTA